MTLDDYCGEIVVGWQIFPHLFKSSVVPIVVKFVCVPIWIVGTLSNVVNIFVYGHRNMEHPINLIFWWLSVSDLFELAVFALLQWFSEWDGEVELYESRFMPSYGKALLLLWIIYMLQVFHTVTIGLNIALAFWRYLAIAHPFMHKRIPCNNHTVKLAIIGIYTLSFVSYLPVWFMLQIESPTQPVKSRYKIGVRTTTMIGGDSRGKIRRRQPALKYVSPLALVNLSIFVCGVILRLGPLIVLIIFSALLIFAVVKTRRNRQRLGIHVSRISEAQKRMNRTNITVIVIVLMFIITEVPFGISSVFSLINYSFCSMLVNKILAVTIALNSSYNMVCYLITSRQYRETLKLLFNKCNWLASSCCSERVIDVEPNLELQPLKRKKLANNS